MAIIKEVVFDCARARELARFWAAALDGYRVRHYDHAEVQRLAGLGLTPDTDPTVMVDGPGPSLCFQLVAGSTHEKNRVHLDLRSDDRDAEMARLVQLGASVLAQHDEHFVLLDPEGDEFCLTERS